MIEPKHHAGGTPPPGPPRFTLFPTSPADFNQCFEELMRALGAYRGPERPNDEPAEASPPTGPAPDSV